MGLLSRGSQVRVLPGALFSPDFAIIRFQSRRKSAAVYCFGAVTSHNCRQRIDDLTSEFAFVFEFLRLREALSTGGNVMACCDSRCRFFGLGSCPGTANCARLRAELIRVFVKERIESPRGLRARCGRHGAPQAPL
jgi:hypothetical protein